MKKVVALETFSTGTLTMEEKQVADIEDALAASLIAAGVCADASTYFGGGSGGGPLVVTDTDGELDKTWDEIANGLVNGGVSIPFYEDEKLMSVGTVSAAFFNLLSNKYTVLLAGNDTAYSCNTRDDYPTIDADA